MRALWERLQLAAPLAWLSAIMFAPPWCWVLTWYLVASDVYLRIPVLLYLAWITVGPGRKAAATGSWTPVLRHWSLFKRLAEYFPARLHKTADLDPGKKYIFGVGPHGILATGFSQLFPGIDVRVGTIKFNFLTPVTREYLLLQGFFDVEREHCLNLLSMPGRAIAIVLGGAAEAVHTERGCYDLVLKRRKGFVKLALKTGASLVPVIAFGENDLFERVHAAKDGLLFRLQSMTRKVTGFTLPLAYGTGPFGLWLGLFPRRVPLNIVVGAPIDVPLYQGSLRREEGRREVDRYHQLYMAAVQQLWDAHKDEFAKDRVRELCFLE